MVKPVVFHRRAREELRALPRDVRLKAGSVLMALQRGFSLGLPVSRPMPNVMTGVEELRLTGEGGQYRVFCFCKSARGVLVLRAFQKKTRTTPAREVEVVRRRLKEVLNEF
jgi:phage-related protein